MNYEHKPTNTVLELWNSKGSLFQNGKLLFRGDGYIAIKFMLQWTNNAKEVQERFKYQLSQREQCKWSKRDEEQKYERRMKEEAERAKESFVQTPKTKKSKTNKVDKLFNKMTR